MFSFIERNLQIFQHSFHLIIERLVNNKISWKIPLQLMDGDKAKYIKMLGSLDCLRSAMIVGDPLYGGQLKSKKVKGDMITFVIRVKI